MQIFAKSPANYTSIVIHPELCAPTEAFENTALFLRLALQSTVIRHENGAFRERSSNWSNLKMPALSFRMDGKRFLNEAF